MKGLFKGLRYISQIFENEKAPEMQIGTPTDVKHVAHIGWDGGSPNQNTSPTWMNDVRSLGGHSSTPLGNFLEDGSFISEDSIRSRDTVPGLPKPSRDRSNTSGSPAKERSRRNPKSSRKSSKESCDIPSSDGSRRSRRKKSKDSVNGGSSRSSRRSRDSDSMSDVGSVISSVSNDDI